VPATILLYDGFTYLVGIGGKMDTQKSLQKGIQAALSGDMKRARTHLARAVQENPRSDQAWHWLAKVLPDNRKKRACLIKALQLNPDNTAARQDLEALEAAASTVAKLLINGQGEEPNDSRAPIIGNQPASSLKSLAGDSNRPLRSISLGIAAGILITTLIFGFMLVHGVFKTVGVQLLGILGVPLSPLPEGAAATLPPVWTTTPSPAPRPSKTPIPPSLTPLPSPTMPYEERLAATMPKITLALKSMSDWDCETAINAWSEIIDIIPEYGPAYYWRAKEKNCSTRGVGDINVYIETLYTILDDIDKAIALDPNATGDYYALRSGIYDRLAGAFELRTDREYLYELSLDDIKRSIELGSTNPLSSRNTAFKLIDLGRCQEAIAEAKRLQALIVPGESPSAGILNALAHAYLCEGQYSAALTYLDAAIAIKENEDRLFSRARILYGLGRLNDALVIIDQLIEEAPEYYGYRYHLRALIHYELGDYELAIDDLQMGYMNTWGYGCIPALLQGLMALEVEEPEEAEDLFRLSEATCSYISRPIWDRALDELRALGVSPITVASTLSITPAPPASPTSDQIETTKFPRPAAHERVYSQGTGRMEFGGAGFITLHIVPIQDIEVRQILSMTIALDPRDVTEGADVTFYLLNPKNGFWSMYPWQGSDLRVLQPERFLYPDGGVYLSTMIDNESVTTIQNVKIILDLISTQGERIKLGLDS
jgi:tetratricopeptide (TPR) repeat protein